MAMPTVTRPPEAERPTMPHHIASSRSGDAVEVGVVTAPPEELLPSGGPDHHAVTRLDRPAPRGGRRAARTDAAFQRRVRAIHAQLLPLLSRAALASSYGREAIRRTTGPDGSAPGRAATALEVAYALRWLELGDPGVSAPGVMERRERVGG